ncbi:uncharacterized protein LOC115288457 isoform X4 [Suricata suricatta]|uniref:uncharacterized protein LOC115288457 isoform X4 n=1 Tax=Suricata suricatta TaxID=37032 RepID=UPI001155AAB4|nr:uncharacterized protein LOC115288457 isoform X4 [Suricata suricatta]
MSPSVSVAIAAVTLAEVEDQTHFTRRKSGTGAVRVWGPGHSPRIHSLSWQVQGPSEELLRHARPGVQSASLRSGPGGCRTLAPAEPGSPCILARSTPPKISPCVSMVRRAEGSHLNFDLSSLPLGQTSLLSPQTSLSCTEKLREPNITASSRMAREGSATSPCHAPWPLLGRGGGTTLSVTWTSGVSNSYRCSARNRSRRAPALSPPGPSAKTPTSLLSAQKLHVASLSLELQVCADSLCIGN